MRRKMAFCVTRAGMSALDQARVGSRARRSGTKWVMPLMLLLGLAVAPTSVLAAPITGEAQPEFSDVGPGPIPLQDPAALPAEPATGADADDLVIEFSIMPSASDPSKMETVIMVQQGGGKSICVTQNASDIISRSYRRRGDLPFNPTTPNEIRGLSSGHSGEFMGFNDFKVFIRPHSAADDFTDTNECFQVADAEACFVADGEDCDQVLREGDALCLAGQILDSSCPVTGHANLMRQLRVIVALNQPAGETPIVTPGDVAAAPELALPSGEPGESDGEPPAGPAPAGPTDEGDLGDSGGGLAVPNLIGLTREEAESVLAALGLVVGTITIEIEEAGLRFPSLIPLAHAQACEPGRVVDQTPVAGTPTTLGSAVDIVLCAEFDDIPEPSSLGLFVVGLGLLILFTWSRRRLG
ncbi:MAG: PASTA domain-containing protein [Alphaproteobacteria bacterium]